MYGRELHRLQVVGGGRSVPAEKYGLIGGRTGVDNGDQLVVEPVGELSLRGSSSHNVNLASRIEIQELPESGMYRQLFRAEICVREAATRFRALEPSLDRVEAQELGRRWTVFAQDLDGDVGMVERLAKFWSGSAVGCIVQLGGDQRTKLPTVIDMSGIVEHANL